MTKIYKYNEQYVRRNNVKLLYIPEAMGAFNSAEESERKALQVFHDRLDLKHTKPEHIEAAPRIGERNADNTSPVLVNFLSRKTMQRVIQSRRRQKNAERKVVIVEDLTKSNYSLFCVCIGPSGCIDSMDSQLQSFYLGHLF